jgi:hypothetical protein
MRVFSSEVREAFFENKTEDDGQSIYGQCCSGKWVGLVVCVGRLPTAARDVIIVERTRRERGLIWLHTQVRVSIFLHLFSYQNRRGS